MRLNARNLAWELEADPYDQFHGSFDDDLEPLEMSEDIHRAFWDGDIGNRERFSIRRKTDRRHSGSSACSTFDELDFEDSSEN